jgi:hypothetical protein
VAYGVVLIKPGFADVEYIPEKVLVQCTRVSINASRIDCNGIQLGSVCFAFGKSRCVNLPNTKYCVEDGVESLGADIYPYACLPPPGPR